MAWSDAARAAALEARRRHMKSKVFTFHVGTSSGAVSLTKKHSLKGKTINDARQRLYRMMDLKAKRSFARLSKKSGVRYKR